MDSAEINEILTLRLLIARAAQPDSRHWWDDNSLTDEGLTLARRVFSRKPERACNHLALKAAIVRHRAASLWEKASFTCLTLVTWRRLRSRSRFDRASGQPSNGFQRSMSSLQYSHR